jgi:hypothetical protein
VGSNDAGAYLVDGAVLAAGAASGQTELQQVGLLYAK